MFSGITTSRKMGSLLRKTGEGWCQVNTLGREVNSWTQPQRALWMGNKGVYSLGEGKASSSLSKTHSAPQRKPVLMWNSSPAPRQYYCLPNQRAPAREQEPTSKSCTKERGKPEGTHPSHWPCSVSHLSAQRRSPSGVALRSPFSAHLWSDSGLCPARDCSVTLPSPPSYNSIVTWPSP